MIMTLSERCEGDKRVTKSLYFGNKQRRNTSETMSEKTLQKNTLQQQQQQQQQQLGRQQ